MGFFFYHPQIGISLLRVGKSISKWQHTPCRTQKYPFANHRKTMWSSTWNSTWSVTAKRSVGVCTQISPRATAAGTFPTAVSWQQAIRREQNAANAVLWGVASKKTYWVKNNANLKPQFFCISKFVCSQWDHSFLISKSERADKKTVPPVHPPLYQLPFPQSRRCKWSVPRSSAGGTVDKSNLLRTGQGGRKHHTRTLKKMQKKLYKKQKCSTLFTFWGPL